MPYCLNREHILRGEVIVAPFTLKPCALLDGMAPLGRMSLYTMQQLQVNDGFRNRKLQATPFTHSSNQTYQQPHNRNIGPPFSVGASLPYRQGCGGTHNTNRPFYKNTFLIPKIVGIKLLPPVCYGTKVCGPIVDTSNPTYNFNHWIIQGIVSRIQSPVSNCD